MDGAFINSDLIAARRWDVTASAAASDSTAVATKAAAAGKSWVITSYTAVYPASNLVGKLIVSAGGTTKATHWVDSTAGGEGELNVQLDEDDWIYGGTNTSVAATLDASSTSGVLPRVSLHGFHVGKR